MSIYASLPGVDEESPGGPPWAYQGSHILPTEDDPHAGCVSLASIPSHITRDGRDDHPDDGTPWPWLRIAIDTDTEDPAVVIGPAQARHLAEQLNAWADEADPTNPAGEGEDLVEVRRERDQLLTMHAAVTTQWRAAEKDLAQVRYQRDQLREALKTVNGQCRGAEGRLDELQKQQAAVNPPGSTSKQFPADILALLAHRTYLSTACETARLLDGAIIRNPDRDDLPAWRDRMHGRCRLNHKFTGAPCSCHCHQPAD
ncbi:hypothetical protein OHR86_28005 [Streptomyces sp. NBC_00441]|uniref:hypothetical protein n=1 Tax=Streptomyces sp. NBC_00441 TaxID=2975742 RepID=UPI002E2B0460|nr:hypothetical protein [Streptomyces sp. NBC_00441]